MKLTYGQRKALKFLRDDEEYGDMVHEPGSGWWLGTHKINGKLALSLIRLCLVTREQWSNSSKYERWGINGTGLRALDGKPPYTKADGTYVDNLHEVGDIYNE
jgi:hypothetical protein